MMLLDNNRATNDGIPVKRGDRYHMIEVNKDNIITGNVISSTFANAFPYPIESIVFNNFDMAMEFSSKYRGEQKPIQNK